MSLKIAANIENITQRQREIYFIINYESESKNVTILFTIWPCQERNVK